MAKQPSPIATAIGQHQGSLNLPCPRYMQRHCFNDVRPGRDSQRLVSFMDFDHVIVELWVVYIVFTPVHFHSIHKWQEGLAILVSTYRSVWNHVKSPCFEVSARFNHHFCVGNNGHFGCSRTKAPSAELWTAFLDVLVYSLKGSGSIAIFHHPGNLFLTWFPSLKTIWISSRRISSMAIINGPQRPLGHSWRTIICDRHANMNIVCGRKFILFHWPSPTQLQGFKKQDWGDAMIRQK